MSSVNRGMRALLAAAVVVGGSLLAQIPNVGSSSEKPPAPAAAPATPAPTNKLAGAGEKDKLEIVAPDAAPRAAIFRRAVPGKMVIADLPLVVRVPKTAKGNLDASLLATSDGATETLKLGPPATLPKGHAALYLESRTHVQAKPGDAVLPLRLAIPPGASPDLADGQLTVKTKSRDPATVTVDGTVADAAVAPNPVKMRVTRWWGPLSVFHRFRNDDLSGREAPVQFTGPGAAGLAVAANGNRTILGTDRNGVLRGTLHADDASVTPGNAEGTFKVDRVNLTGAYAGNVPLAPLAAADKQAPVQVDVQDAFVWPLLVLIAFSFLGGYLVRKHNLKRQRSVLQAALRTPVERYLNERGKFTDAYAFDQDELGPVPFPDEDSCKAASRPDGTVARLYCEIWGLKTDDEFSDGAKRVADSVAPFTRWEQVARAQFDLTNELRARCAPPEGDPARQDGEYLVELARDDLPASDAATATLVQRLRDQRAVLEPYSELRAAWAELPEAKKENPPPGFDLAKIDPAKVYKPEAGRDHDASVALHVELVMALRKVRELAVAPELEPVPGPTAGSSGGGLMFHLEASDLPMLTNSQPSPVVVVPQPPAPPPVAPDPRTTQAILGGLKWWDALIALATVLFTTIAFLLPKYTEHHTFGSWEDYLLLATLGFLGAAATGGLVLNWDLFPSLRSYRPAAPAQQK